VLAELRQRLQQHLAVLPLRARRGERRQPQAEHPPARRGEDPLAAELGDDAELRAELRDRVAPLVGVEVADEVVGLRAHRLHHHASARGGAELRQARGELAVATGAQLDTGEPGTAGEIELGLQAGAWQQLFLAGELHAHDHRWWRLAGQAESVSISSL
jgi:hypothetical protein